MKFECSINMLDFIVFCNFLIQFRSIIVLFKIYIQLSALDEYLKIKYMYLFSKRVSVTEVGQ